MWAESRPPNREGPAHAGNHQIKEVNMLKSLLAAALLASAAAPALAAPAPSAPGTDTVSSADLDLGRAAGRAALARRVRQAVAALCHADRRGPLAQWMAADRCVRETQAQADRQVAAAVLRGNGDPSVRLAAR
jgi:UrcA family protein